MVGKTKWSAYIFLKVFKKLQGVQDVNFKMKEKSVT